MLVGGSSLSPEGLTALWLHGAGGIAPEAALLICTWEDVGSPYKHDTMSCALMVIRTYVLTRMIYTRTAQFSCVWHSTLSKEEVSPLIAKNKCLLGLDGDQHAHPPRTLQQLSRLTPQCVCTAVSLRAAGADRRVAFNGTRT